MKVLIKTAFSTIGFNLIYFNETPQANGVDCWVKSTKGRPMSVEIKKLRKNSKTGAISVEPVSRNRKADDFIAIIFNKNYVLIEPMKDHLKCCGPKGYRPMTIFNS